MSDAVLAVRPWSSGRHIFVTVAFGLFMMAVFLWTQSPMVFLSVPVAALGWYVLKDPVRSLVAFLLINVVLTIRPKADTLDGAPTILDLILGLCLAIIIGYWSLRTRLVLNQPLAASRSQILLHLFFVWAAAVSAAGLFFLNTPVAVMLRELLNLLPLVIVPLLYERYIDSTSKNENRVIILTIVSGVIVMIWNIIYFRNHLAKALYVFQTGRAAFDLALVCLIILGVTSYLMTAKSRWSVLAAAGLLLLGWTALIISFTRTLWIATFLGSIFVILYGTNAERRTGIRRAFEMVVLVVASVAPVVLANRMVRLLVLNFGARLLSTTHASTDRSLMARISEWHGEIARIFDSPIVGSGFGASFRFFDVLAYAHQWYPYSHNSYLFILFKTGIVGGILFFGTLAGFILKGFKLLKEPRLDSRTRMLLRAAMASILVQLFGAFTGPTFCSKTPMVWLGLCWGFLLAAEKRLVKDKARLLM